MRGRSRAALVVATSLLAAGLGVGLPTPARAATDDAPTIGAITISAHSVRALEDVRLDADVHAEFDNPDDPDQIAVSALVTAPDGSTRDVPGFWFQDYRVVGQQVLPKGEPVWQIRYTPPAPGHYEYAVRAVTPSGTATSSTGSFVATRAAAGADGYVRVDVDNPAYLSFSRGGKTFFPVGMNFDVPELSKQANHGADLDARYRGIFGDGQTTDQPAVGQTPETEYDVYRLYHDGLARLAAAGGDSVRVILDSWLLPLELPEGASWVGYPDGVPGFSIGRYNAANAWLVDQILDQAHRLGVKVTLVGWDGQTDHSAWSSYARPANADLGLMERRLRYQVARWGYSTDVTAWELFNEADADLSAAPYSDAIDYLRTIDADQHLVFNTWNGLEETETHTYLCGDGMTDPSSPYYYPYCPQQSDFLSWSSFSPTPAKPSLLSEFGEKWYFRLPADTDPTGTRAHEGMWASLMGHKAGAQYWWYYAHLSPLDLFDGVYRGISRYLDGVDLGAYDWHAPDLTQVSGPGGLTYRGMVQSAAVDGSVGSTDAPRALLWMVRTPSSEYADRAAADGNVVRLGGMQPGRYRIEWYDTHTGDVVRTDQVSDDGSGGVLLSVPDGVTRDVAAKVYGPIASARLTVAPGDDVEPGESTTVTATLTSTGATPPPSEIAFSLDAPDGWQVTAQGPTEVSGPLPSGRSVTATWQITAPADVTPGDYSLTATATYDSGGSHTIAETVAQTALPPPLSSYGPVQPPYATFASTDASFYQHDDQVAIVAGGADMWNSVDQYGTVYLPQSVDETSTATTKVTYQQAADAKAKAGLVMRNDLAAPGSSAGYVMVAVTPGNNIVMNWDGDGNGYLDGATAVGKTVYPCWLRLIRSGTSYTGYWSSDGTTWNLIRTVTAKGAAATQDVGLVASAHAATGTTRADFSGLEVTP
ncbi:NEW3 domain-containing protein [Nocardioides cheoyonin]|uniref:NEW3 domain-containing protein n=1 Tax=Nocardioides cheoyonin TaxID=3156615 RepID=UPI0032B4AA27